MKLINIKSGEKCRKSVTWSAVPDAPELECVGMSTHDKFLQFAFSVREWSDFGSEGPDLRSGRSNLGSEGPDLGSQRPELRSWTNLGSDWPELG